MAFGSTSIVALLAALFAAGLCGLVVLPRQSEPLRIGSITVGDRRTQLGASLLPLASRNREALQRPLAIVSKSHELLVYEKFLYTIAFSALWLVLGALLFANLWGPLAMAVAAGFLGWRLPEQKVKTEAENQRHAMRQAVTVYQELAAAAVAGGANTHAALTKAVDFGSGPQWVRLRSSVRTSLTSDKTLSEEIQSLANLYELAELENLATLLAVSEQGGVAQQSLEDMSTNQSKTAAQEALDVAEKNSSRLVIPIGLLFGSFALFMLFVVFDGLNQINI